MDRNKFRIWSGILDDFPEAGTEDGFVKPETLGRAKDRFATDVRDVRHNKPISSVNLWQQYPLPVVVAMLTAERAINILDFGGGFGASFLALRESVEHINSYKFFVLEFNDIAEAGRSFFPGDDDVVFVNSFDNLPKNIDLIHAGSSFQYVDDWNEMLRKFSSYDPEYIVFGNLLAGDITPCITMQNNMGSKIPVRFHNMTEFTEALLDVGYRKIFDVFHEQVILGERQELPLSHFPEEHRLKYGRNVVFRKI